ncbi:GNAT family N-acetyltransferase [Schlesneria sp. T3-172]|uniref:GNAT family N-acetyltransferase n=1 Tax=Schlesneria sphaerica TaxID=3373610 RepID=UPI0037CC8E39
MKPTTYQCELYESIDDVDQEEWREICRQTNNISLDPRFLKAVEISFAAESKIWYAIFRDENGRAVAATCFSRFMVDGSMMAPSTIQNLASRVRRVWSGFMRLPILLCGLPISMCDHQLAIAENVDDEALLTALDATAIKIARKARCRLISFKEFPPALAKRMDRLSQFGFLKARSVYAYHLEGEYGSFDNYLASRNSSTRQNIKRSFRRFDEAGLTCEQVLGRDGIEHLITPEVYELYVRVLERADVKFERIPLSFFHELARQMPDDSHYTIIRKGEKIVGFGCAVAGMGQHSLIVMGLDDASNRDTDLYFNIVYRGIQDALVPGVRVIHIGAAADEFKQRIGCQGEWLSIYVKTANSLGNLFMQQIFKLCLDTQDAYNAPAPSSPQKPTPKPVKTAADTNRQKLELESLTIGK